MMKHLGTLVALAIFLGPATVAAQANSAQAEQLFRDGKDLMAKKQYAEACTAFEGSDKLDPAVSTKMNLADCREKNSQIATAWGLYLEITRQTRDDKKQKALMKKAKERAAALEPRLSYLIINVREEAKIDGLEITRNGQFVDPLTWNSSLPIDGGEYVIAGKAPGFEAWSTTVRVGAEKDKKSVDVPKFKDVPVDVAPPSEVNTKPESNERPETIDRPTSGGMSGKRKASIGLGILGIAGIAASVVFEVGAQSTYDDAKQEPDDARRTDLTDQANMKRGLAIGAGAVGLLAVGVGAYLWITGGAKTAADVDEAAVMVVPMLGTDSVGVAFTGRL